MIARVGCTIRFVPDGRVWHGEDPVDLELAAAAAGLPLERPCGGAGTCGDCRVRLLSGAPPASDMDVRVLGAREAGAGWRLGCRLALADDATVEVPCEARAHMHEPFGGDDLFASAFDPVEPVPGLYGLAFDLGATCLAVALIEMATGRVAAAASCLNPQVRFATDVDSSPVWAEARPHGATHLHVALVGALDGLLARCLDGAGIGDDVIVACTFVGNGTMLRALRDVDLSAASEPPGAWRGTVRDLDLRLPPGTPAYLVAEAGGRVGADMVAGIVAAGLDRAPRPTMLLDLGTTSQVALGWAGRLLCAGTTAGAAFEASTIHHGMRAAPGAIEQVRIRPGGIVWTGVLGDGPAKGLCGSGLIDAVAELLAADVIEPSGRMRSAEELRNRTPTLLSARLLEQEELGRAFLLAGTPGGEVLLTARDVRRLQVALAGVAAATAAVLEHAGLGPEDLEAVLLAGTLGRQLRKESARAVGLAHAVAPERVRFIGNAAGIGARIILVDRAARTRAERVAATAEVLGSAARPHHEPGIARLPSFPSPPATACPAQA